MKTHQRLHRDPDPRLRRSLAVALLCSAILVMGLLVVVGLRVQQVHLAYQLDALRGERIRTEVLLRQLEIEVATLRSPGRVETRVPPGRLEWPRVGAPPARGERDQVMVSPA